MGPGGALVGLPPALHEASLDWLRPAWRGHAAAEGEQRPPSTPGLDQPPRVGICVETGLGSPREPQGTAIWGPAVTDWGAGVGSAGPWLREGRGGDWPLRRAA